jgi:hypothetical protein
MQQLADKGVRVLTKLRASEIARRRTEKARAEAFFPLSNCSLPLAADRAGKAPALSSLPGEKRVGSLLRSTAPRAPVRATTTAAGSERDARAARKPATIGVPIGITS